MSFSLCCHLYHLCRGHALSLAATAQPEWLPGTAQNYTTHALDTAFVGHYSGVVDILEDCWGDSDRMIYKGIDSFQVWHQVQAQFTHTITTFQLYPKVFGKSSRHNERCTSVSGII